MFGDALGQDAAVLRWRVDITKAHPARVYDLFLGGTDNYPVDRAAAAAALAANPRGYLDIRHNRDFLRRAVTTLTAQDGIRQFLDVGTGLPTQENVHQIAQRISPDSRVVYVDNDPVVLAQVYTLLTNGSEGRTDYIDADLKQPARILEQAAKTLDFDQPVALVLAAVLHFVEDEEAYRAVRELVDALPSGSRLRPQSSHRGRQPRGHRRGATDVHRARFHLRAAIEAGRRAVLHGGRARTGGAECRPGPPLAPRRRGPLPEQADPAHLATLDAIEMIRFHDINDVTEADINIYAATGRKA